jgi:hypothetical protein
MQPDDMEEKVEIIYMYLKNGKWKFKTEIIDEEQVEEYENKYRVQYINKKIN